MQNKQDRLGKLSLFLLVANLLPGLVIADTGNRITPSEIQSGSLLLRSAGGYRAALRIDPAVQITVSGLAIRTTP